MNFVDIYKYNVNDLLRIETEKYIHQCYVKYKTEDRIMINSNYPYVTTTTYYNDEFNSIDYYYSKVISISKINEFLYKNTKYCYFNKEVLIKNNLWNEFKKFDGVKGIITNVSNDIDTTFRLYITFNNSDSKYNHIEIIPIVDAEKIYKPKTKVLDEKIILKFDEFC